MAGGVHFLKIWVTVMTILGGLFNPSLINLGFIRILKGKIKAVIGITQLSFFKMTNRQSEDPLKSDADGRSTFLDLRPRGSCSVLTLFLPVFYSVLVLLHFLAFPSRSDVAVFEGVKFETEACKRLIDVHHATSVSTVLILCIHLLTGGRKLLTLLDHLDRITPSSVKGNNILSHKLVFGSLISTWITVIFTFKLWLPHMSSFKDKAFFLNWFPKIILDLSGFIFIYTFAIGFYLMESHLSLLLRDLLFTHGDPEHPVPYLVSEKQNSSRDTKPEETIPAIPKKNFAVNAEIVGLLSQRMCELQDFQDMITAYFSTSCVALMAYEVVDIIANIYNIITPEKSNKNPELIMLLMKPIAILILLCSSPELVKQELTKLRTTISRWRLKASDSHLENQLTYLLDLVDEFPPCSIGGFFVAAKARLIDVAGFITTYLVILLQFRIGEYSKGNGTTYKNETLLNEP